VSEEGELTIDSCPACGSAVFEGERYCEVCGTKLHIDPVVAHDPATALGAEGSVSPEKLQQITLCEGPLAAISDRGWRRERNEDAVALRSAGDRSAVAVCDGVGSTSRAYRAAQAAVANAIDVLGRALDAPSWPSTDALHDLLDEAFEGAQRSVAVAMDEGDRSGELPPSTTMVVALSAPGQIVVGNVGDSRAYWLGESDGDRRLLTVDDTVAQERIAEGASPDEAFALREAHSITRWIGADAESTQPRITDLEVTEPGLLIVCTDGLWNYFEDPESLSLVVSAGDASRASSSSEVARTLTSAALNAGGQDNITVAVIPVGPGRSPAAPTEE
jgi:serine/threonine protein phosphatase PrpC